MAGAPNPNSRPYTGNSDGPAKGPRSGMVEFVSQATFACRAIWNNGHWGIRDKKGKPGNLSVHATGRAWDASYRYIVDVKDSSNTRGVPNGRRDSLAFINKLVANANELGIEMIIDYWSNPKDFPYGRIWKCDRQRWQKQKPGAISGIPGDWWHIEINPLMADSPIAVKAAFLKVFGEIRPK